jgi:hypothetical protein
MSRRGAVAGLLAAVALLWGLSGVAVASHHIDTGILVHAGDTEVEPVVGGVITVCAFHLHAVIDGDDPDGHERGFWRITNAAGTVVQEGEFDAFLSAPDRIPDSGTLSLPNGTYNLWWDHEVFVPGGSHREKDFAVVCDQGAPTPTPTGAPTSTPTGAPTPTATGSAQPTQSGNPGPTASQTGGVLPTEDTSPSADLTLPPTDAALAAARAANADSSVWPIAIGLGIVAGLALLLTPRPAGARSRVRTRD